MDTSSRPDARRCASLAATIALLLGTALALPAAHAGHLPGNGATYTSAADFAEGSFINTVGGDSVTLDDTTKPFPFIWVAVSSKGTVVKIDTRTGAVVGEYYTSPAGMQRNPSRTTVDKTGSLWVTNRNENGYVPANKGGLKNLYMGSALHVGLEENGQCEDRNGNGVIDTSRGLDDIKPWLDPGSVDSYGGVSSAEDECIIHYVRVNATNTRHLSVTPDNDIWVSGTGDRDFDLIDGDTGTIIRQAGSVGYGGYGGLLDENGVIWSTTWGSLLRWDTSLPLTVGNYSLLPGSGHYGLGRDPAGNVWNTSYGSNQIRKYAPDGSLLGTFTQGYSYAQGVVADANGDVWVAHSLNGTTVGHLRNDGTYVGTISVGAGPTGVAVDAFGKVWATNYNSGTVARIDPALRGGVGELDLTTRYLGGQPYNYSDMTGSVLIGAPNVGSWTVVHDGGAEGNLWDIMNWRASVPGDSSLLLYVSSSEDGVNFGAPQVIDGAAVPSGPASPGDATLPPSADLTVPAGRYLRVRAALTRATDGASPSLEEFTIGRKASSLVAAPAIADVRYPDASTVYFSQLSASLTEAATGAPIEGRSVEFGATDVIDGTRSVICTSITDASGRAACSGALEAEAGYEVAALRGLGYDVSYAGDVVYSASSGRGQILRARVEAP